LQRGCFQNHLRATIRAVNHLGKALSEVDIVNRVCRKHEGAFSDYFESNLADKVVNLESSVLFRAFRGLVKCYSDTFLIYFPRKGKVNHMINLLCFT